MEQESLVEGVPFIKGLLCGSLAAGSLTVPYGIPAQVALFVIAVMIFLDAVFVFGRESHILSFLAAMLLGVILEIASVLAGLTSLYMLITFVVMTIVYLYEFMSYKEKKHASAAHSA